MTENTLKRGECADPAKRRQPCKHLIKQAAETPEVRLQWVQEMLQTHNLRFTCRCSPLCLLVHPAQHLDYQWPQAPCSQACCKRPRGVRFGRATSYSPVLLSASTVTPPPLTVSAYNSNAIAHPPLTQ